MKAKSLALLSLFVLAFSSAGLAEPGGISSAVFSGDGRYLVTTGGERRLRLHDGTTGKVIRAVRAPGSATTWFSFSPDSGWEEPNPLSGLLISGNTVICGSGDDQLFWWKLPSLEFIAQGSSTYSQAGIAAADNGKKVICVSTSTRYLDSSIQLLELVDGKVEDRGLPDLPPPDSSSSYGAPMLSPDGRWAAAWTGEGYQLWNLSSDYAESVPLDAVTGLLLGNSHIYYIGQNGVTVRAYDSLETVIREIPCGRVIWSRLSDDEARLVIRTDGGLEVWDLTKEAPPYKWATEAERLSVSSDGRRVLVWDEKYVTAFSIDTQKTLFKLPLEGTLKEAK